MFHLTSIIVVVLTFFGYTYTPVSTGEVMPIHATIQAYGTSTKIIQSHSLEPISIDIKPFFIEVPNQVTMPEEPIAPAFEVPLPTEAVPEAPTEKIFVATTLEVENISKRPLYSDCSSNPTASFIVHVKDQDGKPMEGVEVSYSGTAENNLGGTFTSLKGGSDFHYTIKGVDEGMVRLTFYVKPTESTELVKHFDLNVTKAPAERPAWCD